MLKSFVLRLAMLLALAARGEEVYFYKLLGDAKLVEAQKAALKS